jgi:hypothetical protein
MQALPHAIWDYASGKQWRKDARGPAAIELPGITSDQESGGGGEQEHSDGEDVLPALALVCATVSAHLGLQALRTMRDQLQQIKEAAGRRPARPLHALCPSDSRRQHCRLRTAPACQISH